MAAAPALAGEYAVLSTGFRIHADHHERDAAFVRLFTKGGVTELPAGSVVAFEPEDYTTPAPAPPTVNAPLPEAVHDIKALYVMRCNARRRRRSSRASPEWNRRCGPRRFRPRAPWA